MLIKEMLNKIIAKEISIKEVADKYDVSNRTIQLNIKKLGYEWNNKQDFYHYVGKDPEPLDLDFSTLVPKNNKTLAEQKQTNSEISTATKGEITSASNLKASTSTSKVDAFDILLQSPNDGSQRIYLGFYFDSDVLSIIDYVPRGYKPELVNKAPGEVFKEKGLLD